MLFEMLSLIFGIIKILLFKLLYPTRISFKTIPKLNGNFKIAIKNKSKLCFGKSFRGRHNVSFRIYDSGNVLIGNNCFMNDNCSINCRKSIKIGNNVIFGQNVMIFDHDHDYKKNMDNFICEDVKIGNNVWIGANVTILKGVTIGDNCVIAAGTLVNKNLLPNSIIYQKKQNVINKVV